jgi:mono/diheme cytochrome c family protein
MARVDPVKSCQILSAPSLNLSAPWLPAIILISSIAACMSLERMAPRVDGAVAELGKEGSYSAQSLRRGRQIYLTKCSKCHSIEPIDRYPVEEWRRILPEMAEETSLGVDELADLHGYILTAHRFRAGARAADSTSDETE